MASTQVKLNDDDIQYQTSITISNQSGIDMKLIRSNNWNGSFIRIPDALPGRSLCDFSHFEDNGGGSIGALSYSMTTAAGLPGAFILAWNSPYNYNPSTSPNKVYGVCGARSLIDSMSWDQIRMLLDKAGSSFDINDGVYIKANIFNNPTSSIGPLAQLEVQIQSKP